ncbi:MAG TPA: hypothetical protein V6D14_08575 [Coleofasciculaceae cyanobacterium]
MPWIKPKGFGRFNLAIYWEIKLFRGHGELGDEGCEGETRSHISVRAG